MTVHKQYTVKNLDIIFSTSSVPHLLKIVYRILKETISRFVRIRIFPPRTARRLGVIPYSLIMNKIADNAVQFTITVTANSKRKMKNIPVKYLVNKYLLFAYMVR